MGRTSLGWLLLCRKVTRGALRFVLEIDLQPMAQPRLCLDHSAFAQWFCQFGTPTWIISTRIGLLRPKWSGSAEEPLDCGEEARHLVLANPADFSFLGKCKELAGSHHQLVTLHLQVLRGATKDKLNAWMTLAPWASQCHSVTQRFALCCPLTGKPKYILLRWRVSFKMPGLKHTEAFNNGQRTIITATAQ